MVAGVVTAQPVLAGIGIQGLVGQAQNPIPRDDINKIWADVLKEYPYQSLQFDQTGRGAVFIGAKGPEDLAVIQPQLVQVRSPYDDSVVDAETQATKIAHVIQAVLRYLPAPPTINFGVKLIYHAPAPARDSVSFLRTELLKGEDDLKALGTGALDVQGSVKYIIQGPDRRQTILIEPLQVDRAFIYIDVDAQFSGVTVSNLKDKVLSVEDFVRHQLNDFLDSRAKEWS